MDGRTGVNFGLWAQRTVKVNSAAMTKQQRAGERRSRIHSNLCSFEGGLDITPGLCLHKVIFKPLFMRGITLTIQV